MVRSWLLVFAGALLSVCAQEAPNDAGGAPLPCKAKVTASLLNVRARPGTRYEVLCQLEDQEEVSVLSRQDGWVEVQLPPRAKAWVAERFVDEDGGITGDRVRVHSGPGLVFTTYTHLNKGDRVKKQGEVKNGWQRIDAPVPSSGWASAEYVEVERPPPSEPEPVAKAEEAKQTAVGADVEGYPGTRDSPSDIQAPPGLGFRAPPMAVGLEEAVIRGTPGVSVVPVAPDAGDSEPAPRRHDGPAVDRGAGVAQEGDPAPAVAGGTPAAGTATGSAEGGKVEPAAGAGGVVDSPVAPKEEGASVPVSPAVGHASREAGQVPEQDGGPAEPRDVTRDGVVLALERGQRSEAATHVLSKRMQRQRRL